MQQRILRYKTAAFFLIVTGGLARMLESRSEGGWSALLNALFLSLVAGGVFLWVRSGRMGRNSKNRRQDGSESRSGGGDRDGGPVPKKETPGQRV